MDQFLIRKIRTLLTLDERQCSTSPTSYACDKDRRGEDGKASISPELD